MTTLLQLGVCHFSWKYYGESIQCLSVYSPQNNLRAFLNKKFDRCVISDEKRSSLLFERHKTDVSALFALIPNGASLHRFIVSLTTAF